MLPLKNTTLIAAFFLLLLSACATLNYEQPSVSLVGFSPAQVSGFDALFTVKLKISNPNSVPLPLHGMSYSIALNGQSLLSGVSNNLPTIPAYGEDIIEVSMGTSLLSAPKFLLSLLNQPKQEIEYEFKSKIDLKGLLPSFNVTEKGILPIK